MRDSDREPFYSLVSDVYAFYRVDCTPFALGVWWEACKPFDAAAVKGAFNRHAVNPDNGQFVPKPADIVKLIGGGTQDGALVAWSKVDRAIRSAGPWQSVVFDDPIIHAVIRDMGNWTILCATDSDEYPFKAKEFENRYRGYRIRGDVGEYPRRLIGYSEAHNTGQFKVDPPVLIGDPARCARVESGGTERAQIPVQTVAALVHKTLEPA